MKKTIFKTTIAIFMAVGMVTLNSCEKETSIPPATSKSEVDENFGKFTKEITVYDETGENSAVLKLGSNDQSILDLWTAENFLLLSKVIEPTINDSIENTDEMSSDETFDVNSTRDIRVNIMMIARNFKDDVKSMALKLIMPDGDDLRLDWQYPVLYSTPGYHTYVLLRGDNVWKRGFFIIYLQNSPNATWIPQQADWEKLRDNKDVRYDIPYAARVHLKQKKDGEIIVDFWK